MQNAMRKIILTTFAMSIAGMLNSSPDFSWDKAVGVSWAVSRSAEATESRSSRAVLFVPFADDAESLHDWFLLAAGLATLDRSGNIAPDVLTWRYRRLWCWRL